MALAAWGAVRCAAAVTAAALLVVACATAPPPAAVADGVTGAALPGEARFALDGRLSARRDGEAVSVHFRWQHDPPHDELVVTTPLGQALAELSGDAQTRRVAVRVADGRQAEAADWSELTERMLGFPLPVGDLAAWVRAQARSGAAFTTETDAQGRVAVLRQEGWEVVYAYADAAARLPARLRLAYPGLEVRLVLDRWQ